MISSSENPAFGFSELAKMASLQPKEELLETHFSQKSLFIGVPKETTMQERRVALTPSAVQLLVANGNQVWVESNAGKEAKFSDREYSEAGAQIVYSKKEVYQADVLVKVEPPSEEETEFLQSKHLIISAIQLGSKSESFIKKLMARKINAMGFEFIRESEGFYPVVRSMSEIAGITSMAVASDLLSSAHGGKGEMLGGVSGIPPTEIVIIGAGTVGEFAAKAALGNGAQVKIFDHSLSRLRRIQRNLGNYNLFTSLIHPKILTKALLSADVVVGCMRNAEGKSQVIVSEETVSRMKPLSVIIDISIDQGGIFETSEITTHNNPTFEKHGVIHYCVPNITSLACRTASYALSNVLAPLLLELSEAKDLSQFLYNNPGARSGMYIYRGNLTNKHIGKRLNIYHKDIDLLLAAHI